MASSRFVDMAAARAKKTSGSEAGEGLGLSWLVRVRFGALAFGALALLFSTLVLGLDVRELEIAGLLLLLFVTNVLVARRREPSSPRLVLALLVHDVVVLCAILALSGAAANPFTAFLLVHVALAAVLLPPAQAWLLAALTVLAFGSLFLVPTPHAHHHHEEHASGAWSLHLLGMFVAYALSASFVSYFVGRVSRALRELDREASELRLLALQNERLAALSSFSASAAHELGSPLATIGLAASELVLALERQGAPAEVLEDARLVRREVARSKEILGSLSSRAGESMGEMPVRIAARSVVEEAIEQLAPRSRQRVQASYASAAAEQATFIAAPRTLVALLRNLLANAVEAEEEAGAPGPVELWVSVDEGVVLSVRDRGPGFAEAVRARLGEPFVTTKGARGGLGLGLYLARTYLERTGGRLDTLPRAGGGAEVRVHLSWSAVPP